MTEERPFEARRILVALDASAASLGALAAAATLARRLGAALEGLFVEDEDLLRLAALPFAGLVRSPGGARERLDPAAAEATLRAVAAHAREALERTAAHQGLTSTFRVVRGRVAFEILEAAAGADLAVLGASSHGRLARGAMGATARTAAERSRTPVLLLPLGARLGGGVAALDDGTPAGSRALAAARRVAPEDQAPARVSCSATDAAPSAEALVRLAPSLVILPAPLALGPSDLLRRLLAAGIATMLVRAVDVPGGSRPTE